MQAPLTEAELAAFGGAWLAFWQCGLAVAYGKAVTHRVALRFGGRPWPSASEPERRLPTLFMTSEANYTAEMNHDSFMAVNEQALSRRRETALHQPLQERAACRRLRQGRHSPQVLTTRRLAGDGDAFRMMPPRSAKQP